MEPGRALRRKVGGSRFHPVKGSRRKARQVLFVHGGGDGAYALGAKMVASLEEKLGPGYVVRFPRMPEPDYETWKRRILKELAVIGDDAILVGHSIGASVEIKLITEGKLDHSVAGVFLISTPFWYDHEVWNWNEVELPSDAAKRLPPGVPVFLYHGRADEVVPFAHVRMYAKALPRAVVRPIAGNHQLDDDLTEVARDIGRLP
jgi:predicted alpha/beta hydrolase family esterase